MFSGNLRQATRKIGFKLSVGFTILFIVGSAMVFAILYFLLFHSLERRDREIIETRLKQYAVAYQVAGEDGLKAALDDRKNGVDGTKLLVRLQNSDGKLIFYHFPEKTVDFDPDDVERRLAHQGLTGGWMRIESAHDEEDAIEVLSQRLSDGRLIQIGKDTDDREETLEGFRKSFLLTIALLALIGLLAGLIFSNRTLRPIRSVIGTIKSIQSGQVDARVPINKSGDELDELALLFNEMLEKNQKLDRGIRESIDAVAHDLRTPMTRILGLAERGLGSDNFAAKDEALVECIDSSNQILTLLNAIMDISEANAGAMTLRLESWSLKKMLGEIADLYELVAEERNIAISVHSDNSILVADVRFKQVLANLVDNALKFSNNGSVVKITGTQNESHILIEVQDEGHGIAGDELSRIWDRLYRGDSSRATRGMGLGLSLVKAIVAAHGGTVEVESTLGKGSIFRIRILKIT